VSASAPAITDEKGRRDLVKELADAVSTQAEVANRTWLALVTVAIVAVIPHTADKGNIRLPFGFEDVKESWFHGIVFSLLVVLAIAFASAHAQQVRAQKLAHGIITSLGSILGPMCGVHPRDYFDMLRKPSLIRIASLAQSLRGKHQFRDTTVGLPNWLRKLTVRLYWLWKTIGLGIYFVFPLVALCQSCQVCLDQVSRGGLPAAMHYFTSAAVCTFAIVSVYALAQVLWQDFVYSIEISNDC